MRPTLYLLPAFVLALLMAGALASGPVGSHLKVDDARVRALIPGQDKTVGYFTVTNAGERPVRIVGASAPGVRSIEMHTTQRDGDMVRMRRLAEVEVGPGETVAFEPGGRHLMLFGVQALPEQLEVDLATADGESVTVAFRRIPLGG